jgi:hypothetical protein
MSGRCGTIGVYGLPTGGVRGVGSGGRQMFLVAKHMMTLISHEISSRLAKRQRT